MSDQEVEVGAEAPTDLAEQYELPSLLFVDNDWYEHAQCKGQTDKFLFKRYRGINGRALNQQVEEAKRVCIGCPVQMRCLRFAVKNNIKFGIWGGVDIENLHNVKHKRPILAKLRELFD